MRVAVKVIKREGLSFCRKLAIASGMCVRVYWKAKFISALAFAQFRGPTLLS